MAVTVERHGYATEQEALAALAAKGFHTMKLDVPPVSNTSHWHSFDAEFVILAGELAVTDIGSGEVLDCGAGCLVRVPARTLHAERSGGGYSILLATSVPADRFGDPVDRPPETL